MASKIIDYLSSGLYKSPAACIKELVNNSYDADAASVRIFVMPDANRIIVEDDGHGLNRQEFEAHFHRISESHKRDDTEKTAKGRPKIGKIGIGFIAANELCNVMEIVSTKKGSSDLLRVDINFEKMREGLDKRRRRGGAVAKGDFEGIVDTTDVRSHYTRVFLKEIRGNARDILVGARKGQESTRRLGSLYGLSPNSISKRLSDETLTSWDQFDSYSANRLQVGLNVPVAYSPDWIPRDCRPVVVAFERETQRLGFSVEWDGSEILKPIVLNPGSRRYFVHRFNFDGDAVSAKGYFFVRHGAIRPRELNGLLVRIRHAAVGTYDNSFLGFPSTIGAVFQKWVSAEIWADDRLEDAMNIDRRTLRDSHPAYVQLREVVHRELNQVIAKARKTLYGEDNSARRSAKAQHQLQRVREVLSDASVDVPVRARRKAMKAWDQLAHEGLLERSVLSKYTVADIYDIVLQVATETLSEDDAARFIEVLTQRLSK